MNSKKRIVKYIITKNRDLPVTKTLLKRKVLVYNGNRHESLELNKNILGNPLGSLTLTKKMGKSIHDSERNGKRNKKKHKKQLMCSRINPMAHRFLNEKTWLTFRLLKAFFMQYGLPMVEEKELRNPKIAVSCKHNSPFVKSSYARNRVKIKKRYAWTLAWHFMDSLWENWRRNVVKHPNLTSSNRFKAENRAISRYSLAKYSRTSRYALPKSPKTLKYLPRYYKNYSKTDNTRWKLLALHSKVKTKVITKFNGKNTLGNAKKIPLLSEILEEKKPRALAVVRKQSQPRLVENLKAAANTLVSKKDLKNCTTMHSILVTRMSMSDLNRIEKRSMMLAAITRSLRNVMHRGNILANPRMEEPNKVISRPHSNYSAGVRTEDPHYEKNPVPMKIHPQHGLEIMRTFDASGKNHVILIDNTFQDNEYYLVRGSFTSKSTPYDGRPPDMVAPTTFEGKSQPQFMQNYSLTPRLIPKSSVVLRDDITILFNESEYKEYLNSLPDYPQQTS